MHSQPIPKQHVFFYLGIFFKHTDILSYLDLVSYNTDKFNRSIQLLSSIRLSSNCFFKLLLCRLYQQIVRSQIEHGLATFISLVPIIYNWDLPEQFFTSYLWHFAFIVHKYNSSSRTYPHHERTHLYLSSQVRFTHTNST